MSNWFVKLQHSDEAKIRLFFFHYAGGGASIFRGWERNFGKEVDVFAVQFPGRENRFSAAPISCLETKIDCLQREIDPYLDVPCIFVGHSMGGMIAFELARALQARSEHPLVHLVLSAVRAPHLPPVRPIMAGLSHEDFIEELKVYSRTPHDVLDNREIMDVFMPMLRADFGLCDSRIFRPGQKLAVPTTLFSGVDDDGVPFGDAKAWSNLVEEEPDYVDFDGGHFFIHTENARFISEIKRITVKALSRLPCRL